MLDVLQIILSLILVVLIILQAKGTGLGSAFGGGSSYHTKRGAEKFLFTFTIIAATLYVITALFNSLVK